MKLGYSVHEGKGKQPEKCQDCAKSFENDQYAIICVADGISSSPISDKAAIMNVEYAIGLFQRDEVWGKNDVQMRDEIIADLKDLFRNQVKGYEATLTAVAVRKADGEIRGLHIGDGAVIGITENMDIYPIQYPAKLFGMNNMTVCTVYYEVLPYMMGLWRGSTKDLHLGSRLAGIVICTDGGGSMLFDCPDVGTARLRKLALEMQEEEPFEVFRSLVDEIALSKYTRDDVSVAGMLFGTVGPQTAEQETVPEASEQTSSSRPEGIPAYALPALEALREKSLSIQELEERQFCMKGRALEAMMPLIRAGLVECKDDHFSACVRSE